MYNAFLIASGYKHGVYSYCEKFSKNGVTYVYYPKADLNQYKGINSELDTFIAKLEEKNLHTGSFKVTPDFYAFEFGSIVGTSFDEPDFDEIIDVLEKEFDIF